MKKILTTCAVTFSLAMAYASHTVASDEEEGKLLYAEHCQPCHGAMDEKKAGFHEPSEVRRIQLAMLDSPVSDITQLISRVIPDARLQYRQPQSMPAGDRLAVAMPNGPALRGVVGRTAVSVEDYKYSKAMLEKMQEVVWSEENLGRWITNSQAWVPGSFMFYKQADAEIRRKIISFLKANP